MASRGVRIGDGIIVGFTLAGAALAVLGLRLALVHRGAAWILILGGGGGALIGIKLLREDHGRMDAWIRRWQVQLSILVMIVIGVAIVGMVTD